MLPSLPEMIYDQNTLSVFAPADAERRSSRSPPTTHSRASTTRSCPMFR